MELIALFAVGFLASVISDVAGFGGALILLPILVNVVGVKEAVPVLTIAQIFGNASRVWFGRLELNWQPIIYFLVGSLPFTVIGSRLFVEFNPNIIIVGVGILLICIVVYRRLKNRKNKTGNLGMLLGGALTGLISGIAGSAGPLGASLFLGLNLSAVAYVASEAFTALTMHITKTIIYQRFDLIGKTELLYGVFIGISMILGSWAGKRIIEKLPKEKFVILVEILLLISGIQMIIKGIM